MSHIFILEDLSEPLGLMTFRFDTVAPLNELAEVFLRGPSVLTQAERELIGIFVFSENDCLYCQNIHGVVAATFF